MRVTAPKVRILPQTLFTQISEKWGDDVSIMAIMIGIQASGKSSFCKSNLKEYVRINLDELNTRNKERIAIMEAIQSGVDIVIDNTNPTKADREKYVSIAKNHGYEVIGYFMQSRLQECIDRNEQREGRRFVPKGQIRRMFFCATKPKLEEGFSKLYIYNSETNKLKERVEE